MDLETKVSATLRHLALDETVKAFVLENKQIYRVLMQAASRFIGGETLNECISVAQNLNAKGHRVTIDFMGESTRNSSTAQEATEMFLSVIEHISLYQLDASVSFDLSHLGMIIDPEIGYQNARKLAFASQKTNTEMMISMEGFDRVDTVLDIYSRLSAEFDRVGITLQAFLHRTPEDLERVIQFPGKIRLVKGAYEIPPDAGLSRGKQLDERYIELARQLIQRKQYCSIATHDIYLLDQIHTFVQSNTISPVHVEFEMLKGVTPERLELMRDRGYSTRVYLPFGREWYLYLCNRLAEFPPNIYQAISDAAQAL